MSNSNSIDTKTMRSLVEAANRIDGISEAAVRGGRSRPAGLVPKSITDVKVGTIFYLVRGTGDQMPEFYEVVRLGETQRIGNEESRHAEFASLELKRMPAAGGMAGNAVPVGGKQDSAIGVTIGRLRQVGGAVRASIVHGRNVPDAQPWDGKPVPYTAWG
jgi:hypothetical protein